MLTFAGWFYICHNDYQALHCIVETGSLLLHVLLVLTSWCCVPEHFFFKSLGKNHYVSARSNTNCCSSPHAVRSHYLTSIKTRWQLQLKSNMWIIYFFFFFFGCSAINSSLGVFNLCFDLSACSPALCFCIQYLIWINLLYCATWHFFQETASPLGEDKRWCVRTESTYTTCVTTL